MQLCFAFSEYIQQKYLIFTCEAPSYINQAILFYMKHSRINPPVVEFETSTMELRCAGGDGVEIALRLGILHDGQVFKCSSKP